MLYTYLTYASYRTFILLWQLVSRDASAVETVRIIKWPKAVPYAIRIYSSDFISIYAI